jgi:hypothetical protein
VNLTDLHRRLLHDVLAAGSLYPLVITGGYAVQAHGLVDRVSHDLDLATESQTPMSEIAAALSSGLTERGWSVRQISADPLSARLIVTAPATGEECEVDILKEAFWQPPHVTEYGPVLALDDVIGTKVRLWPTAALSATSSTHTQLLVCAPTPSWRLSVDATRGTSSALTISPLDWAAPSGMRTRHLPLTASPVTTRPPCALGLVNGLKTSRAASTRMQLTTIGREAVTPNAARPYAVSSSAARAGSQRASAATSAWPVR